MRITKKFIGQLVEIRYASTSGEQVIFGKIHDVKRGFGMTDIAIFPIDAMSSQRMNGAPSFCPLWTLYGLIDGMFTVDIHPTFKKLTKAYEKETTTVPGVR